MTEKMLLEALIERYGFANIVQMLESICDAKAAEMAASGDMKSAKDWALRAADISLVTKR